MAVLHAGVACLEIPSWAGLDLAGFVARENPATGIHDPIYARALALQSGDRSLLIIVVDCLGFQPEFLAGVRSALPEADLFLTATHTHSAPATQPLRYCGTPDPAWLATLHEVIVQAGKQALAALEPATLRYGAGFATGITTNRRQSGGYRQPQEPVDHNVQVLSLSHADGSALATLVRFTCHPVILGHRNREISADWPGQVCAKMTALTGAPALCINGATGDVGPYKRDTWREVEWVSDTVVAAAKYALEHSEVIHDPVIGVARDELHWSCRPLPSANELATMSKDFAHRADSYQVRGQRTKTRTNLAFAEWAEHAREYGGQSPAMDVEVIVARIGDIALAGAPGELFVRLGQAIATGLQQAGYRAALVTGFTNGNIGYIPDRPAYLRGGYEVDTAHRYYGQLSALTPECGELLVERAIELGKRLLAPEAQREEQPVMAESVQANTST